MNIMKLYTQEKLRALKKRAKALSLFLILLMTLSLIASVVMCFFVKTENASRLLLAIITLMTLSGWTAILVLNFASLPYIRESRHMEHILKELLHLIQRWAFSEERLVAAQKN